jgi:hypothetical protein
MALPTERTVTGTYTNPVTGEPYDGTSGDHYVIFEPIPERWTDQGGNQILLGGGKVNLDAEGSFSEDVVCTDAEDVLPEEGRLWRLRQFVGGDWEEGIFEVPVGSGALDITDVLSVDICGVDYVPVPGPTGPQGDPGATGDSAYEIAVENGFEGTEEEWLDSLVGPQGEAGIDGGLDTGISEGGDISPSGTDPLAVIINPLSGRIVNYLTDPVTVQEVEVTAPITVQLDAVAQERTITWLLMDADQAVYQQETRPSAEERRNFLVIGMVAQDNGSIFLAQSIPTIAGHPVNQLYDLMDAIGAFGITGNDVSPNGVNLSLDVSSGQVFSRGWNHFDGGMETSNPHIVNTIGEEPAAWVHALRTSELPYLDSTVTVDVGNYDSGGTLTPVGGTAETSVVHQLWMFPTNEGSEIHVLQYGQQTYATLDEAVSSAGTAPFATNPALPGNAILLGYLAVKGSATDLSDITQASIIKAGKFGSGPGGGTSVDLSGYALLSGAEFTGEISTVMDAEADTAQSSRSATSVADLWRRLIDGEMQWGPGTGPADTFLRRLSAGVLAFLNTDLLIGETDAKAYRFRQSGASLDLDASGADLFLSVFELVNFLGTQHTYLRLESGTFTAHASGKWVFGDGPFDGTVHTIDGVANQIGLYGAVPVGRQTVSGERTTGAALQSLLDALELVGLITDATTAGEAAVQTVNGEAGPDVLLTAGDVGVGDVIVAAADSRNASGADYVCTGTDDHLIIQQAIDLVDAATGKGTVRLLDGTFWLGATLNIPDGAGLELRGSGWGTILKLSPAVDDYAITFSGLETRARFSHFTIDGNLTGQTTGPSGGIWAPGAVECVFQHIHFTACLSTGLFLGPQTGPVFGHNNQVLHCLFDNAMDSTGEGRGVFIQSNDENVILASDFQFLGGSGAAGAAGIYDQAGTQTVMGCNFVGGGNSLPAIRVQDASATKVTGCNFDGVGGDAVFLAATNCVIEGNTIFGVGAIGTAGTYSGIHLEFAATGNLISDNSISSHTVDGAARSLIREEAVGDSGDNLIVGNMLITNGTLTVGALDLNAPGTVARSNFGGGADGDPIVTSDMVGAANGVASLDAAGTVPPEQLPATLVTSVNGEAGDVTLDAADVGALDQATADTLYSAIDSLYFNALDHGAVGDGVTDDAAAINTILTNSPAGSVIALPAKPYAIGVPLVVHPGKTLMGIRSDLMTVTGLYEPGVVIMPTAGFTGVAAIRFLDQATGGYAAISGEQRVLNVTLDGGNVAAGVDGIQAKGNIQNVALRDVTIRRFPNSGIYCGLEGGIAPYSWRMHRVMLDNNEAHGMFGERMVDLTMVDCQAIGNFANGFMLQNAANSQIIGCRAEWHGNHGFYLSGDWGDGQGSGGLLMSACSTDRNGFNGVFIDASGTPPLVISNLMTRRDGRNGGAGGGGYAGVAVNSAATPVIIGDWTNFPGVDDGGAGTSSPEYGGSITDSAYVQIDNAYLHAATAGLNDGGGNGALRLGSNITYVTGATSAPVRNLTQSHLAETWAPQDVGLLAWSSDPANCQSNTAFSGIGTMRVTAIVLHNPQTVGKIVWYAGGYAGGLLTGSWAGIWSADGTTRLGGVADLTAPGSEPAVVDDVGGAMHYAPLDAGPTYLPAGIYMVAWRHVYTASPADGPQILQYENSAGAPPNTLALNTVKRFGYNTTPGATLPTSLPTINTDGGNRFWVALAT